MDNYNDDIYSEDDLEDDEEPGCYFTDAEEDINNNCKNIASFTFEQPSPSPVKENKADKIDKSIQDTNVANNCNEIKDLRTRSIVPPSITSNDEIYLKRCYLLKESTLRKLIILTANEEHLYFNVSNVVDAAINYYYDNTIRQN